MKGVVLVISLPTFPSSILPIFFFHIAQKTGKKAGPLLKKQAKIRVPWTFRRVSVLKEPYEPYRNQEFDLLARFLLMVY